MPINIYVPADQSLAESRHALTGGFVTKVWLAFFNQLADLLRRISTTGTIGGIVVTDDNGVAQVITGEMDTIPFDALNFTSDVGTWDLAAGDQVTFAWAILGRMVDVAFTLTTTTITGAPTTLSILIPDSKVAAKTIRQASVEIVDNAGTPQVGRWTVTSGGTTIDVQKLDGSAFAAATDTTAIRGMVRFEVDP